MPNTLAKFISIEETLAASIDRAWAGLANKVRDQIIAALKRGDEAEAISLLNDLDFTDAMRKVSGKVEFLMVEALMLGAQDVVPPSQVIWSKGEPLPEEVLEPAKFVFEQIMIDRAIQFIKRTASKVIEEEIQDQKEEELQVQKLADAELAQKLNAAVRGGGKVFADISSNLTTSRMVSFGFLAQAQATGIKAYELQATLDERTSQICRRLHGRRFDVERSYFHTLDVLKTQAPEDLKAKAPFVDGTKAGLQHLERSNSAELQAEGIMVPPFHPRCRTVLVKVGGSTRVERPFTPVRITPPKQPALDPVIPEPVPATAAQAERLATREFVDLMDGSADDLTARAEELARAGNNAIQEQAKTAINKKVGQMGITETLPEAEVRALTKYTSNDFEAINGHLRGKRRLRAGTIEHTEITETVQSVDSALAKNVLDKETIVYRRWGSSMKIEQLDVGDVVTDKGYTSTSVIRDAYGNIESGYTKITLPKGTPTWYIDEISQFSGEHEVLLPRGGRYRVTKKVTQETKVVWDGGTRFKTVDNVLETEMELILGG